MIDIKSITRGFSTPESRWARFGPYYAMFPVEFAFDVINKYSSPGDYILDPFSGRCTSVFAGGVLGRHSLGIEINPVGWLFGSVKLNPAHKEDVIERLFEIYNKRNYYRRAIQRMPEFYRLCYCDEVLKFLLSARKNLNWEEDETDATLMSIILVYLHAKLGEGLSNQMRMTKSMGMNYSVNWWKSNGFSTPPELNPAELILSKINWRYEKGLPKVSNSAVVFGDSTVELTEISERAVTKGIHFSLLFTSPPYCAVTDYYADQWLRLWMLGGSEYPNKKSEKHKGRFEDKGKYYELLDQVFFHSSKMMSDDSTVYVRTDKRKYTFDTTYEILVKYFPDHFVSINEKPLSKDTKTQTKLFGDKSLKPGEVDIILTKR